MNIKELLIEDAVADSWITRQAQTALPTIPTRHITQEESRTLHKADPDKDGGCRLLLAKQRGRFLKLCPGYQGSNCCAYFILHVINGCPFSCTYCALGAVINSPFLTIYANTEDLEAELERNVFNPHTKIHRVGTGQFSDSLALDYIAGISPYLVELFASKAKGFLELKSKSNRVHHLLGLDHGYRTIVSFSLSLPQIVEQEEGGTASLVERLKAAATVQEHGYRVGLHFDPLVEVEEWKRRYNEVVEMIDDLLDPEAIVWVSLGTLRLDKTLRYRMRTWNPSTTLDLAELQKGYDGRFRYLPELRFKMYSELTSRLRRYGLPVYLCMEASRYWKKALGWEPRTPLDVKGLLDDWALNRWPRGWRSGPAADAG